MCKRNSDIKQSRIDARSLGICVYQVRSRLNKQPEQSQYTIGDIFSNININGDDQWLLVSYGHTPSAYIKRKYRERISSAPSRSASTRALSWMLRPYKSLPNRRAKWRKIAFDCTSSKSPSFNNGAWPNINVGFNAAKVGPPHTCVSSNKQQHQQEWSVVTHGNHEMEHTTLVNGVLVSSNTKRMASPRPRNGK